MKRSLGVTLIELLIVVALIGVILVLAAPAFKDMILMQRLRGINSELVTNLQFARSEAVARRNFVRLWFDADPSSSCYTIYTAPIVNPATRCNCLAEPGTACTAAGFVEVKSVRVPKSLGISVVPPSTGLGWVAGFSFDWRTGGIYANPTDTEPLPIDVFVIDASINGTSHKLSTRLNPAGRPTVCRPSGSTMSEAPCT